MSCISGDYSCGMWAFEESELQRLHGFPAAAPLFFLITVSLPARSFLLTAAMVIFLCVLTISLSIACCCRKFTYNQIVPTTNISNTEMMMMTGQENLRYLHRCLPILPFHRVPIPPLLPPLPPFPFWDELMGTRSSPRQTQSLFASVILFPSIASNF